MRPVPGSIRMSASAVVDLPEPDSPTTAKVSPAQDEGEVAHGGQDRSVGGCELDAEVADLQQLLGGHRRISRLSASAMSESPRTSAVTVIRGPAAKWGAWAR